MSTQREETSNYPFMQEKAHNNRYKGKKDMYHIRQGCHNTMVPCFICSNLKRIEIALIFPCFHKYATVCQHWALRQQKSSLWCQSCSILLKKSCGEHKTLKQVCISATHYPPLVTNLKSPNFLQLRQPLQGWMPRLTWQASPTGHKEITVNWVHKPMCNVTNLLSSVGPALFLHQWGLRCNH